MAINKLDYIQAATLVKVEEKKLITTTKLNRMIESNNINEFLKILSETTYGKNIDNLDIDKILNNELKNVYKFSYKLARENNNIVDVLALKYDYQNLKLKIKYELKDKEFNFETLSKNNLDIDYNLAKDEYEKTNDIQMSMILLDKLYLSRIKNLSSEIDEDIINEYYNNVSNKYNIITFLRLKSQNRSIDYANYCFIDDDLIDMYSEMEYLNLLKEKYRDDKMWKLFDNTNKISDIEKILENRFIEFSKKYKYVSHGIEPIITYILAKEFEMKAIKLIYTAKLNNLSKELIRERVREIYV